LSRPGLARRALIVAGLSLLGAIALALEVPLCPSATLLGIPCPGCGLTRATLAILRGDVRSGLALHPLVFVLGPLFFGLVGAAALSYVRGPRMTTASWLTSLTVSRTLTAFGWLLLVSVVTVWAARFFGAFGGPVPVKTIAPWGALTR
jgi:Protein of unknown function (DUF2752)